MNSSGLNGKVCALTGGGGVLGGSMAQGLVESGVKVAVMDLNKQAAEACAEHLRAIGGADCAMAVESNVLERASLEKALADISGKWSAPDFLLNTAGGNAKAATTTLERLTKGDNLDDGFFGLDIEAFRRTMDLNLIGTVLPSMVFGRAMAERGSGAIVNISSMSALHPLTKVVAYSASKAAVSNFTEWLAVHLAGAGVRVNAIAPGFFLTEQNRFLLTDEKTGALTERGGKIIAGTPQRRFGEPHELVGLVRYLLSDDAAFVTGTTLPVDGGFNAYAGV